jgi:hypothetical protein
VTLTALNMGCPVPSRERQRSRELADGAPVVSANLPNGSMLESRADRETRVKPELMVDVEYQAGLHPFGDTCLSLNPKERAAQNI